MINLQIKESDLDFVVETAASEFGDKEKLKQLIREDEAFRKHLIGHEEVFKKVMTDEEIGTKISPSLFFEILLRNTRKELEKASYTVETTGRQRVPVFDITEVVNFLTEEAILKYLATLLASFIRIERITLSVKESEGVWRTTTFDDMDIDNLCKFSRVVDKEYKFIFYKRIADVCLFVMGVFPEYLQFDYRYLPAELSSKIVVSIKRSAQDYEDKGRTFYRLAAEHEKAKELGLTEVFWQLSDNFNLARKPLNLVIRHFKRG